jgi:hypothetical protein
VTRLPRQRLTRAQRRALLTLHIALSVGWLGGSVVMLTFAIAARAGSAREHATRAYWAMHLIADSLLVPLSIAVLVTGVVVALTTPWGLLRHRWVIVKLIATCAAVTLSLSALPAMTGIAFHDALHHLINAQRSVGSRLVIASTVSVTLYLCLTAVSVFKPWGRTARGEHVSRRRRPAAANVERNLA